MNRSAEVWRTEDSRACDEDSSACPGDESRCSWSHAAVDFERDGQAPFVDHFSERRDLWEDRRQEGLAAEAGIDSHREHEVEVIEDVGKRAFGRVRVEGNACGRSELSDSAECPLQMRAGFDVDRQDVCAGSNEVFEQRVWMGHHEVHVDGQLGGASYGFDDERADGDVGDEVAVHHVDVDPSGAGELGGSYLIVEVSEVGGEDGRGDDEGGVGSRVPGRFGHDVDGLAWRATGQQRNWILIGWVRC